jgi:hypothetical protein
MNEKDLKSRFKIINERAQDIMQSEFKVYIPPYIDNVCYKKDEEEQKDTRRLVDVKKTYRILGRDGDEILLIDTDFASEIFRDIATIQYGTEIDLMSKLKSNNIIKKISEEEFWKNYYILLEIEHILFLIGRCGDFNKNEVFIKLQAFSDIEAMKTISKSKDFWNNSFKLHSLMILFYMNERGYRFSEDTMQFVKGKYETVDGIIL